MIARRLLLTLCVFACSACGGSQLSAPPPEMAKPAEQPVIPKDPAALVPNDALLVVHLNVDALEKTSAFESYGPWLDRFACVSDSELSWLTSKTRRVVLAAHGDEKNPAFMAVLEGSYEASDLDRALDLIEHRSTTPASPRAEKTLGAFTLTSAGPLAATLLEERLLVVGTEGMLESALELTSPKPPPRFSDQPDFRALDERIACSAATLCVLTAPGGEPALARELARYDLKALGKSLARSRSALALTFEPQGELTLAVVSQMSSPDEAQSSVKQVNDKVWQLGLLARLMGMADLLDSLQVQAHGPLATLDWRLSKAKLDRLHERVGDMLQGQSSHCPGQSIAQSEPR